MATATCSHFGWEGLNSTFSFLPENITEFNPHRAKIVGDASVASFCLEKEGGKANSKVSLCVCRLEKEIPSWLSFSAQPNFSPNCLGVVGSCGDSSTEFAARVKKEVFRINI